MASKGCWTCKDRKVACDRGTPKCLKCTKTKRECGGYGMRLTWPKQERNHTVIGHTLAKQGNPTSHDAVNHWINVHPTDIRLHLVTSTLIDKNSHISRQQLAVPTITELELFKSTSAADCNRDFIEFFKSVIANILPTLYTNRHRLVKVLVEKALSNRSQASRALYHSVLALASYHRHADMLEVDRFKRAAIRDLYTHADMSIDDAVDHIAANMLLCVLEMQQTYGDNSCWISYLNSLSPVISVVQSASPPISSDTSVILGWLFHFEVMARFSLRHWRTQQMKALVRELGFDIETPQGSCIQQFILAQARLAQGLPEIAEHAHPVVRLLADVSHTAMYSSEKRYLDIGYQTHLEDLRGKLEGVSSEISGVNGAPEEERKHMQNLLELNRLAGLIYLERVSRNFSGHSIQIRTWVTQALSILGTLETCVAPFALFIVGCELHRDEDRMRVLNLFANAEKGPHLRSFLEIRALIQTAWNQQDLAGDEGIEYIYKLGLVMSSRNVVPSLI